MTKRLLILGIAAGLGVTLGASSAGLAAQRVVGGTATQVQSAPWAVLVRQTTPSGALLCSGAILDALHVLTAGHCMYDPNGAVASVSSLSIRAGISNFNTPQATDVEQLRTVSSFRIHPNYAFSAVGAMPDDVAVLALAAPLDLTGPAVQATPLPTPGTAYPAALSASMTGFGREAPSIAPNGSLNSLSATVDGQGECGSFSNSVVPSNNAVAFCASSTAAAVCNGDSGAVLVTDSGHMIVGIASAGPAGCGPGSHGIYTYVAAPEILGFIQGDDHPPIAPRQSPTTFVTLYGQSPLHIGSKLTCVSGNWDGAPTLSYAFVDSGNGRVVQQGAGSTLVLSAQNVGSSIECRVIASNAGGATVLTTTSTEAIGGIPHLAIEHVAPAAAGRGKTAKVQVWLDPEVGVSGTFGICVTPPAKVAKRGCASRRVGGADGGRVAFVVGLRIKPTSPLGTVRLAISAVAGVSSARATAVLRVARD